MKLVVLVVSIAALSSCALQSQPKSLPADERATLYWEHFSERPVPRSIEMDQHLVDLNPWNDAATLALYADPEASGMARICVTPLDTDDCDPPIDQTRRPVGEANGYRLFLFSGPGDVGFDSELASRSADAVWEVVTAP